MAGVNFDDNEIRIIEKFWVLVDSKIADFAFEELEETLSFLPEILTARQDIYQQSVIDKKKKEYIGLEKIR